MVRHPRDAPAWTFVTQTTPANTDFSAPGTPGAISSPPQLDDSPPQIDDDIGFEADGEGEGNEGEGGDQEGGESSQNRP
jgi:hypothetical protein